MFNKLQSLDSHEEAWAINENEFTKRHGIKKGDTAIVTRLIPRDWRPSTSHLIAVIFEDDEGNVPIDKGVFLTQAHVTNDHKLVTSPDDYSPHSFVIVGFVEGTVSQ